MHGKVRDRNSEAEETAVRGLFIQEILQTLLGYTPFDPASPYTLAIEEQIRSGAVDAALGRFNEAATARKCRPV